MPEQQKETIYLDVDDEITGIIDRVKSSGGKIVALVLPKRATVMHSIVNMKLLKRAADEAKKHIVLITSETGVLPLAGAVGMHVAKTLQSKPEVPAAAKVEDAPVEFSEPDADVKLDNSKPIGVLAGIADEEEETIQVDNADKPAAAAGAKATKNKKLKIPDFNTFRNRLFLAIGVVTLLIIGWIMAAVVLPKATITIKTNTSNIVSKLTITARPDAKELVKEGAIIPAMNREFKKSDASKVPVTGEKNVGEKAKGTVKIYNCNKADKLADTIRTVAEGTILSAGNINFVLSESIEVEPSSFVGDTCLRNKPSDSASVVAQTSGDQSNLNARKYSIANLPSMDADGSDMSGGTTKIVKVVAQADVDGAKQKIQDQNQQAARDDLTQQLRSTGYIPIPDTFAHGNPVVTASPNVGDEAGEVNVNVTATYTMLGAKEDALRQVVEDDVKLKIDQARQTILDNGLSKVTFQNIEKQPSGDVKMTMTSEAIAGVQQDAATIRQAVAGKKRRDTQTIIAEQPGVEDVTIHYSPFWVFSTPKRQGRITINFE